MLESTDVIMFRFWEFTLVVSLFLEGSAVFVYKAVITQLHPTKVLMGAFDCEMILTNSKIRTDWEQILYCF